MTRRTPKPARIGTGYAFDPRLDLNLFRVFDAIYTHGGISGAARALHLTQPAISHSLGRLREVFDDPLFIRTGNHMVPTERTRAMIDGIRQNLLGLFATVQAPGELNPLELDIEFRLALRDVLESTAIPVLMKHLDVIAPKVRLACRQVARENFERELATGSLDFVLDRRTSGSPNLKRVHLADESVAVVAAADRFPKSKKVLSGEDYLAARHAVVSHLEGRDPIDSILAETGLSRRVTLRAAHYFSACRVVSESDILLTMPRRYAEELARLMPLRVFDTPVPVSPIQVFLYWHVSRDDDRVHQWMRELVIQLAAENGWLLSK
jgi:DNA-binding transcriptional LysR family regulator